MAGYDNIKDKGFDHRSTEELREIQSRGGRNSGKVRREKADFRKTLNQLLTAKIDHPTWTPILESMGLESTPESAMNAAMVVAAMNGNVKAAYYVAQYAGQSMLSEEDRRNKEADTELKQARKQAVTGETETNDALDRLDQILKEVRDNAFKQETE